jgi:Spy/CpxP family protein refolding chaperone
MPGGEAPGASFLGCDFRMRMGLYKGKGRRKDPPKKGEQNMKTRNWGRLAVTAAGYLVLGIMPLGVMAQSAPNDNQAPATTQQPAPQNAPVRAHRMHEQKMLKSLNLTDDQKAQIQKIREDAKTQIAALRSDTSLSDTDKRTKMRDIHRGTMKQVQDVLTPEQRQQLQDKMRERREKRQQREQAAPQQTPQQQNPPQQQPQ